MRVVHACMIAEKAVTASSFGGWEGKVVPAAPNVRAKLAPMVGLAGQVGENVQGTVDLARVARRWGST